jgi:hypothetical protein
MARAFVIASCSAALLSASAPSCAPRLKAPVFGAHPTADCATAVPSPPPEPAQVDEVTRPTDPREVWVDGYWVWRNRRWDWEKGSWQLPPPGGYYARPALIRIPVAVYGEGDGGSGRALKGYAMALMAYPGHWHLQSGEVVPRQGQTPPAPDAGSAVVAPAAP